MIRSISRRVSACAAVLVAVAFASPAIAGADDPSIAAATYEAAVNAGDADAVAALYHPNAMLLAPDGGIVRGRDAIRTANEKNFAAGAVKLQISEPASEFGETHGTMFYGWTLTITPPGAAPIVVNGRSLLGWVKTSEGWVILADMFQTGS